MPPKRQTKRPKQKKPKAKAKSKTITKSTIQSSRQNVVINIIKPQRKVKNKPYQGVPQIRRIEYIQTYGRGDSVIRQPVVNQPQIQQPLRLLRPQIGRGEAHEVVPSSPAIGRGEGVAQMEDTASQVSRTRIGTLRRLSMEEPPLTGRVMRPRGREKVFSSDED